MMKVEFYGTRGSFPVSNPTVVEFGGNTTCLSIQSDNQQIVIDAGTGIRRLGNDILLSKDKISDIYLFITHYHMDHIQGLPFFLPAFDQHFTIHLASLQKNKSPDDLKKVIDTIMGSELCPVSFEMLNADFQIHTFNEIQKHLPNLQLETIPLNHPGGAGGIKVTDQQGKSVAVLTDHELLNPMDAQYLNFCKNVDVLVHDAQYTEEEYLTKKGWGHSTYDSVLLLAEKAHVGQLILTHHDPDHGDDFLNEQQTLCQEKIPKCLLAKDGLVIHV